MKLALLFVATAAVLAGCQRPSGTAADSGSDTRAMGAASAAAPASAAASASKEDLDTGRAIALQGAPGAAACASCHGPGAQGNPAAGIPRLAGLARPYIEHQLNSYADGTRANPVMTQIAGALSAQQREQVAAFFASLAAEPPANANTPPAPAIVAQGDGAHGVPACASCHGAQGQGDGAAIPALAGQNENYLATALAEWKDGTRHNDRGGQMPAIAKALTEAQAQAAIAYYASLPPASAGK
jgi:cytochrome c553